MGERTDDEHHDMSLLTIEEARANPLKTDWDNLALPVPWFVGRRVVEPALSDLLPYLDWTTFTLEGGHAKDVEHPAPGGSTRGLPLGARALLDRIVAGKLLTARGVYGFWPANADGDDIVLYTDDSRRTESARFHMLRQQAPMADGPNQSLADFVAPRDSFAPDYVGTFVVTAGIGIDRFAAEHDAAAGDDASLVEAVVERLGEAFAAYLHRQAREDWGYGADESLTLEALHAGKYRGIRPAFGQPACPDLSERSTLFALLRPKEVGIGLTESFAVMPPGSVTGLYFSHPNATYFDVGRLGRDQLEDYARRKGVAVEQVERWLGPHRGR